MSGRASKRKGFAFEREIVKLAQEHGFAAERARGSDGRALGMEPEVDVLIDGKPYQCKRKKSIPIWLRPSSAVRGQIIRGDRDIAYVLIPLSDYLEMI